MARVADQVEVMRMTVRRLETRPAFAEVNLPRETGVHHPLQCSINGRASDAGRLATDEIEQVVRAQMPLLLQKDPENLVALARVLAAYVP